MQRRTLCCPLQMVQYFSQVQRSSGKSHCAQWVGPCMGASPKTLPEHGTREQGEGREGTSSRLPALLDAPTIPLAGHGGSFGLFQLLGFAAG
jgi:hypothetical protein